MNKLETIPDPANQEMIDFFSISEIVTGCLFMNDFFSFFL
jgi:hypothetical protein